MEVINFDYDTTLNVAIFEKKIWKEFSELLNNVNVKKIYLDMRNVKFIAPIVLPKLCYMGMLSKRRGIELELVINAYSNIKYYLSQLNFFDIVKRYQICTVDDGLIGGEIKQNKTTSAFLCFQSEDLLSKYERKYKFNDKISEKDRLKICLRMEILGESYWNREINEDIINKSQILSVLKNISNDREKILSLALDFIEIIHNSLWHGKTICFFCLQACTYKKYNNRFSIVDISVLDCGSGLYDSFIKKNWEEEEKKPKFINLNDFLSLKDEKEKFLFSLLEMIVFRKDEEKRGIYDVMLNLLKKKELKLNVYSKNIQVNLNENILINILNEKKCRIDSKYITNIPMGFGIDISFKL